MRFSPAIFAFAIAGAWLTTPGLNAQDASDLSARIGARRDLELAKSDLRYYWQVEYPRQQRELNAAIELTDMEVRDLQARLRAYGPYGHFSSGVPFMVTLQNTRMCLREAELRLNDLRAERNNLVRFHSDRFRELELRIYEARVRVLQLEPEDEKTIVKPAVDHPAI